MKKKSTAHLKIGSQAIIAFSKLIYRYTYFFCCYFVSIFHLRKEFCAALTLFFAGCFYTQHQITIGIVVGVSTSMFWYICVCYPFATDKKQKWICFRLYFWSVGWFSFPFINLCTSHGFVCFYVSLARSRAHSCLLCLALK